jgi:hypothetical protein
LPHTHTPPTFPDTHTCAQVTTAGTTDYEDGGTLSESIESVGESIGGGAEGEEEDEMF